MKNFNFDSLRVAGKLVSSCEKTSLPHYHFPYNLKNVLFRHFYEIWFLKIMNSQLPIIQASEASNTKAL